MAFFAARASTDGARDRGASANLSANIDYLYDENGVPYGGVYRSPATSTSPTYFTMVTDDRGDVVELLDAAGNPFAAYHYDCWGWINEGYDNFNGIQTQATSLISATLASSIVAQQHLTYAGYVYDAEMRVTTERPRATGLQP